MKPQVIITKTKNGISISSPFSHSNNAIFRSKGGTWNSETKCWDFPNTAATLEMIKQLFGAMSPLARVRIPADEITEEGNQWKVGGYVVGHRQHCDSPVAMPPGVQLEKGEWGTHGGTAAEPRVTGSDDLVVTAVVHRSFAEREGLEVIATEEDAVWNPLAERSIEELEDELKRRKAENKESINKKEESAVC